MSVENPSALNLDERLNRLVESAWAAAKAAESAAAAAKAAADAAEANRKVVVEAAESTRKSLEAAAKAAEADRDRLARLEKSAESTAKTALDHRLVRLQKSLEATAKAAESTAKAAEADRDRLAREAFVDYDEEEVMRWSILTDVLEDQFAACLPRVMEEAHGIVIHPRDIQRRVRRGDSSEYDFVASNDDLVLVCYVKNRLERNDVVHLDIALRCGRFREDFPEYARLPVYGVMAGDTIYKPVAQMARLRGLILLRVGGGRLHPDAEKGYQPKKF